MGGPRSRWQAPRHSEPQSLPETPVQWLAAILGWLTIAALYVLAYKYFFG